MLVNWASKRRKNGDAKRKIKIIKMVSKIYFGLIQFTKWITPNIYFLDSMSYHNLVNDVKEVEGIKSRPVTVGDGIMFPATA